MTRRLRTACVAAATAAILIGGFAASAAAQTEYRRLRHVFRLGQDLTVDSLSEVREVIVVMGTLTVEGRVERDVYVWLGDVRLGPSAVVEGSLIVVAGDATIARGAAVGRDLAVVGGTLDAPADFAPGGDHALVGAPAVGRGVREFVPWVTRGLLWGRPIVPDVPWVWAVVGVFLALAVMLTLIFGQAVRASTDVVLAQPLRSFLAGMVVLVVTGPLLVLFAATIVGLVVLPVVVFALAVAWTIGKVGVARGIGQRVLHEHDPESRVQAVRSVVIGFAAIVLAYMVPVLGLIAWSLISVFGLGAATIAMLAALRTEYPKRPRRSKAAAEASMPTPASGDDPAGAMALGAAPAPAPEAPSEARATFLDRTAAFALDCLLVAIIDRLLDSRVDGMYFILLVSYHIAFWTWQATTLGGIIVGLRVVRTDGQPLRPVDALVRGLSSVFSFAALGIGCFWMLHDPERQTWHDMIAGTYVVKVPREAVLREARS